MNIPNNGLPWDCIGLPGINGDNSSSGNAELCQWPLKLRLVSSVAPYFHKGQLLLAADCSAFTYKRFHNWVFKDRPVVIGCPYLDGGEFASKINEIIKINDIESVTVIQMDAPCCGTFSNTVMTAIRKSGKDIPLKLTTIFTEGETDF